MHSFLKIPQTVVTLSAKNAQFLCALRTGCPSIYETNKNTATIIANNPPIFILLDLLIIPPKLYDYPLCAIYLFFIVFKIFKFLLLRLLCIAIVNASQNCFLKMINFTTEKQLVFITIFYHIRVVFTNDFVRL